MSTFKNSFNSIYIRKDKFDMKILKDEDNKLLEEDCLLSFLREKLESIFKISKKIIKADNIKNIYSDFRSLLDEIKYKFYLNHTKKIRDYLKYDYDNSIFDILFFQNPNTNAQIINDTMYQNNKIRKNIIKNIEGKISNNMKTRTNNFLSTEVNLKNCNKIDFSNSKNNISLVSLKDYFYQAKNEIDIAFKKKIKIPKIKSSSLENLNISNLNNATQTILNEMSIFPNNNNLFVKIKKKPNNNIEYYSNNIPYINRNLFENLIKDIIFHLINSEDITFSSSVEIKKHSFLLILLFLKYNFISDVNYIQTLILRLFMFLYNEYENEYSKSFINIISKIQKTNISKFNSLSKYEKDFLIKSLGESLDNLEKKINSNNVIDPINYFKQKDFYVKNALANKINNFEVSAITEKIVLNSMNNSLNNNQSLIQGSISKVNSSNSADFIKNNESFGNYKKTNPNKKKQENKMSTKINYDFSSNREEDELHQNNKISRNYISCEKEIAEKALVKIRNSSNDSNRIDKNEFFSDKNNILSKNYLKESCDIKDNISSAKKNKYNINNLECESINLQNTINDELYNYLTKNNKSTFDDCKEVIKKNKGIGIEKKNEKSNENIINNYENSQRINDNILFNQNNSKDSNIQSNLKKISIEKKCSLLNSDTYSSIRLNCSISDFKRKIKEEICSEKIIDHYIDLKFEAELLEKKMEDIYFNDHVITEYGEIQIRYLYIFKCLLEKIDKMISEKNPSSEYFKEKFFYLLFRTNIFGEYILKEFKIENNFLSIKNKAIFLDKILKIGKFLYFYLLENENLKSLDFINKNEFTRLTKNIINPYKENIQKINLDSKENENLILFNKLNLTELYFPYLQLRTYIDSIIRNFKKQIFDIFRKNNIEENNFDCYEPLMANSLNYLYFYNSNLIESSEIFLNFNIYNLKSKQFLYQIIEEIQKTFNNVKEIKEKIIKDDNDGVMKIILKMEKEINDKLFNFFVYLSFNSEECFFYDNLLNYVEYDINILFLFRILKFFLIQRNMFYSFSFDLEKYKIKKEIKLQNLIFDNISLLSLIVIFFSDAGLIPYKESNFEYRKFYCQRINKVKLEIKENKQEKIDEIYYIFPFPLGKNKQTFSKSDIPSNSNTSDKMKMINSKDSIHKKNELINKDKNPQSSRMGNIQSIKEEKISKIYSIGNLFINFWFFVLNLINHSKESHEKIKEEKTVIVIDLEKLLFFYPLENSDFLILIAGLNKFVNTVKTFSSSGNYNIGNKNLISDKIDFKEKKEILNKREYEEFSKKFKKENQGKDTLVNLNAKKINLLENEIVRCLHYFLKEKDEDFLRAFFSKS